MSEDESDRPMIAPSRVASPPLVPVAGIFRPELRFCFFFGEQEEPSWKVSLEMSEWGESHRVTILNPPPYSLRRKGEILLVVNSFQASSISSLGSPTYLFSPGAYSTYSSPLAPKMGVPR